ncbi:hypothetical protein PENTCL1PPCAC_26583, partial [Pristionchus entomophagus]
KLLWLTLHFMSQHSLPIPSGSSMAKQDLITLFSALGSSGDATMESLRDHLPSIEDGSSRLLVSIAQNDLIAGFNPSAFRLAIGNEKANKEVGLNVNSRGNLLIVSVEFEGNTTISSSHSASGCRELCFRLRSENGQMADLVISHLFRYILVPFHLVAQKKRDIDLKQ